MSSSFRLNKVLVGTTAGDLVGTNRVPVATGRRGSPRPPPPPPHFRAADATASELLAKDSVLREEILGDALVIACHPSGDGQQ
jgi:hypothetical protein